MLLVPFLTDIDPQAAVKGSRDPLGVQTIWARLGRQVVGNLTTVTTSVRDFTTLLLGYYFAERVANECDGDGDLAVFLRWEQLAAYARGEINHDWQFRGVERARKNLSDGGRIRLGTDAHAQILSNQKTYGLWGLYTVPAKSSGLVEGDPSRLAASARDLVEQVYLPVFSKGGLRNADAVVSRLAKAKTELDWQKSDRNLLRTVASVLKRQMLPAEREVYRRHLLLGGPLDKTAGAQEILAQAMESTLDDVDWRLTPARLRHLAKRCSANADKGWAVAECLERIRTAELLLAPAAALFDLLLASDGQTIAEVSGVVKLRWGSSVATLNLDATRALEAEFRDSSGDVESGRRWVQLASSLASGDFDHALSCLLHQNRAVMNIRAGGAPWVDITDGRLRVRFRDNGGADLPERSLLPEYWRHPYFLDSLRAIAMGVRSAPHA